MLLLIQLPLLHLVLLLILLLLQQQQPLLPQLLQILLLLKLLVRLRVLKRKFKELHEYNKSKGLSKAHISNVIATASCIKLKHPGLDKGSVQLTKRQYVNVTAATSTTNTLTTTVTIITTMPKGMKVKFSRNIEGGVN